MLKLEKTEVVGFEQAIRGMRNPMNSWDKSDSGICKGGDNGIGCEHCYNYECSHSYDHSFQIGINDHELMMKLVNGGPVHAKFRRMIAVYVDVTAPLYWWKEFDTYKVGTVANSCSTMHKIAEKEFEIDDFSHEHLNDFNPGQKLNGWTLDDNDLIALPNDPDFGYSSIGILNIIVKTLNFNREKYLEISEQLKSHSDTMPPFTLNEMKARKKQYWWQMIQLLPSSYNQKRTVMLNYEVLAGIYPMRKDHKLDEWHTFCEWIEQLPYSEIIIRKDEHDG